MYVVRIVILMDSDSRNNNDNNSHNNDNDSNASRKRHDSKSNTFGLSWGGLMIGFSDKSQHSTPED